MHFTLQPRGPFSLEPARRMQCGFLAGARTCTAAGAVTLAFPLDGTFEPVAVRLSERPNDDEIDAELFGTSDLEKTARPQVERMLGLDHDARPFFSLLRRDPVLRALLERRPAFRPVVAASPYAMAGWGILSQRLQMTQAARIQERLAIQTKSTVEVNGARAVAFPSPERLLRLEGFAGIQPEKWRRLQAVARAALEGELDWARLSSLPLDDARERLQRIHGVGAWTANAILIRGCGPTNLLPATEPMLHGAVQAAYGLARLPTDDELEARSKAWQPFRTWVSVFLVSADFQRARSLGRPKRE